MIRCAEGRDDRRRQDPHVASQHDQIGRVIQQRLPQPVEMGVGVVGCSARRTASPAVFGDRLQIGVIGKDAGNLAVQLARRESRRELLQAMRFPADQQRDLLVPPLAVQMDAHLHVDLPAQFQQAGDQLGKVDGQILQIDQHVHQEKPAHDALLDVLDIDPPLGHVGGELRNDTF